MLRLLLHGILHFLIPGIVARLAFKARWWRAWLIMSSTNLVDLDHLLATPVFDANRCSIPFHPLHSYEAIALYGVFCFVPLLRLPALGLLIHMALDGVDCLWMRME